MKHVLFYMGMLDKRLFYKKNIRNWINFYLKCYSILYLISNTIIWQHHCSSDNNTRSKALNNTEKDISNHSLTFDWPLTNRNISKKNFKQYFCFFIQQRKVKKKPRKPPSHEHQQNTETNKKENQQKNKKIKNQRCLTRPVIGASYCFCIS
jgi:hypothetical protein